MATTFAVLGPLSAGWVADDTGSFVPVFLVFALMLGAAVLTTALFLRAPLPRLARAESLDAQGEPMLVPAE
jgi:cyanate permease